MRSCSAEHVSGKTKVESKMLRPNVKSRGIMTKSRRITTRSRRITARSRGTMTRSMSRSSRTMRSTSVYSESVIDVLLVGREQKEHSR